MKRLLAFLFIPVRRLEARAERAEQTLAEEMRTPKARAIKVEAEERGTVATRQKDEWRVVLAPLGSFGNAFSGLLAATLIGAATLCMIGDAPLQTVMIVDTYPVPFVWAAVVGIVLAVGLSSMTSRILRAAALRSTMFAPWLRWSLWIATAAFVVCAASGGIIFYVRWAPPEAIAHWNAAARYARWALTETLPILAGALGAAGWLVNLRRHATARIEALDDELETLATIIQRMDHLLPDEPVIETRPREAGAEPTTQANSIKLHPIETKEDNREHAR
jgi:hypothetical protein